MNSGRKGMTIKWLAGICAMVFIGAGNVVGVMAHRLAANGGMFLENAAMLRWLVTGSMWIIGLALSAAVYALGAAMQKIDMLEMWILSLDTAVRNQSRE